MVCARQRGCTNLPNYPACVVCPYGYECPVCHQPPGTPCRRPSGHNCAIHIPRVEIADDVAAAQAKAHEQMCLGD